VDELPEWEQGTVGVLSVHGPHAIPISTATRASGDRLVFALGGRRDTLDRLRAEPAATFTLLAEGLAFTAHGFVSILREEMRCSPAVAALELRVRHVQDHLADARTEMLSAPAWRWSDERAAEADENVRAELAELAAGRSA
jgi:hypothetical protein